jgi:predicted nuclease of predicted toxin-antitoxin system
LRLLVDNQLPQALARHLRTIGWDAVHVSEIGFERASDKTIWRYATKHAMVVVTKDQDFQMLASAQGSIPPQVIWVRMGNCRRQILLDSFTRESGELMRKIASGSAVIEIR